MNKVTNIMKEELGKLKFKKGTNSLISNITANEIFNLYELQNLLIRQIENRVRGGESIVNLIDKEVGHFMEIGRGTDVSGLVPRIHKNVEVRALNNKADIQNMRI